MEVTEWERKGERGKGEGGGREVAGSRGGDARIDSHRSFGDNYCPRLKRKAGCDPYLEYNRAQAKKRPHNQPCLSGVMTQ